VQKGIASILFIGPGNRILLFVWCLEAKLQGIDVSDDEELKSEILTIFQGIPSGELKTPFDDWIERCQRVVLNAGSELMAARPREEVTRALRHGLSIKKVMMMIVLHGPD
jgi:hypothetical protein